MRRGRGGVLMREKKTATAAGRGHVAVQGEGRNQGAALTTSLPVPVRMVPAAAARSWSLAKGPISTRKLTPRGATNTLPARLGTLVRMLSAARSALAWAEKVLVF